MSSTGGVRDLPRLRLRTARCLAPDERVVPGGAGLHPRQGPGILEIGYWIRSSAARQGAAGR